MSGGVDSSVAAVLMKEQGFECAGMTMQMFEDFYDTEDARNVAVLLGMSYYIFDFSGSFEKEVIKRFAEAYIKGDTPNPCVDCNRSVKFRRLFEKAEELGCYYAATGHYANAVYDNISRRYLLKKAADIKKDQSYVLYTLDQEQLRHIKFPLGNLTKPEVRGIAEKWGFSNASRKESQDICFISDGDYAGFIEKYTGIKFPEGDFIDKSGNILGRHKGIIRYTIGQRKGLGLALKQPAYVCGKRVETNDVILCAESELYSKSLTAGNINLIALDKIDGGIKIKAKIRYNMTEQPATAEQTGEDALRIEFESPQRAVTKGQAVVLYDGDIVIGGGTII
jgi:tRNA-specific 2-thiouridylase